MPQIPNALIPCYVVQLNNTQFIVGDSVQGRVLEVPCKNDFIDDPDYWMVPIKDAGILTVLEPIPVAVSPQAPTYDSFPVMRVRDKLSGYTWWVYGTHNDFVNSCSTCCGTAAIPMPHTLDNYQINIAPCDELCILNGLGQLYSATALPTLTGAQRFYPYGSYDNTPFPGASGAGYADPASLLAFLNSAWHTIGSPAVSITWTLSPDNVTLIATMTSGAVKGDIICVVVSNILAST